MEQNKKEYLKELKKQKSLESNEVTQLTHAWGIASLCCGIAGLVLFLAPYLGIVFSILAVVFHSKQKKIEPTGVSMGGYVTGIIGIVINSLMLIFVILALLFYSAFKGIL